MAGKDFFEMVYQVVRLIPKGRVTSYGAIASYLGAKGSSRLVGYAMNGAGKVRPKVPAHRVVNRQGLLTGKHHFETPYQMQELLEKEKIKVKNDKVIDFTNTVLGSCQRTGTVIRAQGYKTSHTYQDPVRNDPLKFPEP
jgi:methylated-DNA-protein-cysteine methyltransferase-like protein